MEEILNTDDAVEKSVESTVDAVDGPATIVDDATPVIPEPIEHLTILQEIIDNPDATIKHLAEALKTFEADTMKVINAMEFHLTRHNHSFTIDDGKKIITTSKF